MLANALVFVTALVVVGAAYVLAARLINRRRGRKVLVGEMMRRQGVEMKDVVDRGLEDELVARARLCLDCEKYGTCRERMRSADRPDYRDICPNAKFIDGLKA